MADNRCSCSQGNAVNGSRESVCIDAMRILDSCRDRDCYEDVRVYLTACGQELIEHTATVRGIGTKILGTAISVDEVPFNQGFYRINVRFYIKIKSEACIANGSSRDFYSLAIVDKSVVLYGAEGATSVFRTSGDQGGFCSGELIGDSAGCAPTAVVEATAPILLNARVVCEGSASSCGCSCDCRNLSCGCELNEVIPAEICAAFAEPLIQIPSAACNRYLVSIGIFSVIRLERPMQYTITATEYAVPDKECGPECAEEAPCCLFRTMAFPTSAFGCSSDTVRRRK